MKYTVKVLYFALVLALLGVITKMYNTIDELSHDKLALKNEVEYMKSQLLGTDRLRLAGLLDKHILSGEVEDLQKKQKKLLARLTRTLKVTAYSASEDETDGDPGIAASNKPVRPGTVAVSRDLFDAGWSFGKKVHIEGLGTYVINDLMSSTMKKRVDVFLGDKEKALKFGLKQKKITLLGD